MDRGLPALDPEIVRHRAGRQPSGGYQLGEDNYYMVREYFRTHLCATQVECARSLGLNKMTVNRHVKRIRAEWE
jgi:DNA invertase Pin-like site-specific DNA recombinase